MDLESLCGNSKSMAPAGEEDAEKGAEVFVAAVFRPPSVIAAPAMAH
jgi:hypothetical protein